ncbi:MAG: potassium channel family protein [Pseudobdellovibrio sp.]
MINKHHRFMWNFTKSFVQSLSRPVFIYLTTLAITAQLFFASIFYWAEGSLNPSLQTFFDSLYFTVTVMTGVGLGDIYPTSVLGKFISMLMMLSGTVIFVCFTGVLAASILQIESEHIEKQK